MKIAPKKISSKEIIFGCTGNYWRTFPFEKISHQIPNLINKINILKINLFG